MSPPSASFCITAPTFLPHRRRDAQFTPLQIPTKLRKGAVLFQTKQELSRDSVYSQLPQPKAQQKADQVKCSDCPRRLLPGPAEGTEVTSSGSGLQSPPPATVKYKFTVSVTQGQALPPSGGTLFLFCKQKEPRGTSGTQMVTICYTFAMLSEHQVELRRSSH